MTTSGGMPYGLQAMLKEGHKHFSGVEEAVMKSVEACKAIAKCTRTSLGPTGSNSMPCRTTLEPSALPALLQPPKSDQDGAA